MSPPVALDGRVYGLNLTSHHRLQSRLAPAEGPADLTFRLGAAGEPPFTFPDVPAAYESPYRNLAGESVVRVHRAPGGDFLRFPGVADFHVGSEQIVGVLRDPSQGHMVEILLLSTVLVFRLERAGIPGLHASAVAVGEEAAVFLSGKEAGKTSLACALMREGLPLLADDILALERTEDGILARPAHPNLRLWPGEVAVFLPGRPDLPLVHPDFEKRRVPVGAGGFGTFETRSRRPGRIYLPARRPPGHPDESVSILPLGRADAVLELIRHSFAAPMVEGLGWQERRLALFAELVRTVPVRRLVYPSGFEHLARVALAVVADLDRG